MSERRARAVSAAIVGAFVLWELGFVLTGPALPLSHDELNFLADALRLPAQGRLSGYSHGPFLYEAIAAVHLVLYGVMRLLRIVPSPEAFLAFVLEHLSAHLALSRALVGVFGVLLLLGVRRLAELFAGPTAGVLAMALCATNLTVFALASTVKEDVPFVCLLTAAMLLAWDAVRRDRLSSAVMAGACVAAAFAAKYFGVVGLALCAVPLVARSELGGRRRLALAAVMAGAVAVVALLLVPFPLTDRTTFFASIRSLDQNTAGRFPGLPSFLLPTYAFVHLPSLVGWPLLLAAACELVLRLRTDPRGPITLGLPVGLLLLLLGARAGFSFPYYVLPCALLAMALGSAFTLRMAGLTGRAWLAPVLIVLYAVVTPAFLGGTLKHALLLYGRDTRLEARDFLHAHATPGDCVVITGAVHGENSFGPPLLPMKPPEATGTGAYAAAATHALSRAVGPRFQIELVNGFDLRDHRFPDCRWVVLAAYPVPSRVEFGDFKAPEVPRLPTHDLRFRARVLPPRHSLVFPSYSTADYEELHRASLGQMARDAAFGLDLTVLERRPPAR